MTNRRSRTTQWLGGAALGALTLGVAGPLAAQTAPSTPPAATAQVSEVVVTAQRRTERLVDVPVTVTAVSGRQLNDAGVQDVSELSEVVPAFRMDFTAGYAQPTIRGISTAISSVGGGSDVGTYVDGFYDASPLSSDFNFLNVSSVQVLKGPQGTLFGRNTAAGAILVTTTEPQDEPTLHVRASYSSYDTTDDSFYGSIGKGPIALDLAALYHRSDGFTTDIVTGDKDIGRNEELDLRAGAKIDLTAKDYLLFHFGYSHHVDPTPVLLDAYEGPNGQYESIGTLIPGDVFGKGFGQIATPADYKPYFGTRLNTGQLEGNFDLGIADLKTYTQLRDELSFHDLQFGDLNNQLFRVQFHSQDRLFTQEALLNSEPGGRFSWVTGLFFMDQVASEPSFAIPVPGANLFAYHTYIHINSYAGFADGTYRLMDRLYLTAGARYSYETDVGNWVCSNIGLSLGCPSVGQTNVPEKSWSNFSPRGVLRYNIDDDSNVYASISRGWKAGFIDVSGFNPNGVKPESLTAYEVGYKLARGGTRLETSAFYYDYNDLQVSYYPGNGESATSNAANVRIYGGEVDLTQRITEAFTVSANVAYTHARYISYLGAPADAYDFSTGMISNAPINASGDKLARSPDWTGNVSANYDIPLAGGDLALNANLAYTSQFYFDPANQISQGAFALLDLRATWTEPHKRWSLSVWGQNVTDTHYINQSLPGSFEQMVGWGSPATYGVTVDYKY